MRSIRPINVIQEYFLVNYMNIFFKTRVQAILELIFHKAIKFYFVSFFYFTVDGNICDLACLTRYLHLNIC